MTDYADLVKRLRTIDRRGVWGLDDEAADAIEALVRVVEVCRSRNLELKNDNARLREALREIAAVSYGTELSNSDADNYEIVGRHLVRWQSIARAAQEKP